MHCFFSEMLFSVSMLFGCYIYIYIYVIHVFFLLGVCFLKEDGTLK